MLEEVAALWDKMESLSRLSHLFPEPVEHSSSRWPLAVAASFVIVALVGLFSVNPSWLPLQMDDQKSQALNAQLFQTGTGEQSTIILPDGSQLTLNTNSRVRYDFSKNERALYLEQGEVHVQVAHNKQRPFNAYAGGRFVQAVGTAFNLEITEDQQVELIVTEGKVLVGAHSGKLPVKSNSVAKAEKPQQLLRAGQQILLGDAREESNMLEPAEIDVKLSWQKGNLIFRGESLESAIAEIERYTTVEFVIVDEDLKQVRVAGLFKAGDVDGLLQTLQQNFNVTYQRFGDEKIILGTTE
jgi:transmembrane sensor